MNVVRQKTAGAGDYEKHVHIKRSKVSLLHTTLGKKHAVLPVDEVQQQHSWLSISQSIAHKHLTLIAFILQAHRKTVSW